MKYKYSVIIPVYNAEKTIRRCIDTLLNQNDGIAEIILINDGSKDNSGAICKAYAQENDCIVYIEQDNAGASSARNVGLDYAGGEYITFVDSDDYVMDGYFAALECSDDDFVVFEYQMIRSEKIDEYHFSKGLISARSNEDRIIKVISNRIAAPWNKRFKKSIIEENYIRFKEDLIIGEDFIFGLEYMLFCKNSLVQTRCLYCVDETNMLSVTRAVRYDYMQYLRIYQYAFKIAEECNWDMKNKEILMQQLDYLYCRTAFVGVEQVLRENDRFNVEISELVDQFADNYNYKIKAMNFIHGGMRAVLKYRISLVFKLIAYLHVLITDKKR